MDYTSGSITIMDKQYKIGGHTELVEREFPGWTAENTGLGYWEYRYYAGNTSPVYYTVTHLASGFQIPAECQTQERARAWIEKMVAPFTFRGMAFTIDWTLSAEQLQALPIWNDIQSVMRQWSDEIEPHVLPLRYACETPGYVWSNEESA